jgi:acetolactate synthase I/II/III large subunit
MNTILEIEKVEKLKESTVSPSGENLQGTSVTGSVALLEIFMAEKVDTIFGYPGGAIMPVYDALYD